MKSTLDLATCAQIRCRLFMHRNHPKHSNFEYNWFRFKIWQAGTTCEAFLQRIRPRVIFFSETGSPNYIAKSAIFKIWVFWVISMHHITLYVYSWCWINITEFTWWRVLIQNLTILIWFWRSNTAFCLAKHIA